MNEAELFNLLKLRLISDLEYSEGRMSKYDCYSIAFNADIELKCRKTHYDELVIERIKWDALIERANKFSTIPVYINYTPVGLWSFKLLELPVPEWSMRRMPKSTEFSNRSMIQKEVGYLHTSLGKDLSHLLFDKHY